MKNDRRYLIRAVDGRLIGTAHSREEARRVGKALNAASIEPDDGGPELEVVIESSLNPEADSKEEVLGKVVEYLLGLDPEELERQSRAEVRGILDRKYPGGRNNKRAER